MIYGKVRTEVAKKGNGRFARVKWEKTLETRKGVTDVVQKFSEVTCRFGIKYENMKSTQEKRAVGILPQQNQGLPWGQWVDNNFIEHKGNYYLRLYLIHKNHVKTSYYKNGIECSRADVEPLCLAKEFKTTDAENEPTVFTIKVENIMNIK